jgi:enamine deaminase RidA (YjgF/YER057c/UK114 family)
MKDVVIVAPGSFPMYSAIFVQKGAMRENYCSGARWESTVGYSRAVRIGNIIEVSGTVAVKDGEPFAPDDPYRQTICIIEIIAEALEKLGGTLEDVIRTRIYVTDIKRWEEVGLAHGKFFSEIQPVTSMVEVSGLISEDYFVEIEASAVLDAKSI